MKPEKSKVWFNPELYNMEMLNAYYEDHAFPRHMHETYVIELVEEGIDEFWVEGKTFRAVKGDIVIINPCEVHTGRPAGNFPLRYRSFYPSIQLLSSAICETFSINNFPVMPNIIRDAELFLQLTAAHRLFEEKNNSSSAQALFIEALGGLIVRYSCCKDCRFNNIKDKVRTVKNYLCTNYSTNISLTELSNISGLSPFHLTRLFRDEIGLPPYEYLLNMRIEEAKRFIIEGRNLHDVICSTGFYDQSHFIKHFKKIVGVTPRQYLSV